MTKEWAVNLKLFKELTPEEEIEFRLWARNNWKAGDPLVSVWHPKVIEECGRILDEYIRKNTKKHINPGNLNWSFVYKDQAVALESSSDIISEEEQYEMAIEHFWETEWDTVTNEEHDLLAKRGIRFEERS